jgi:hypothetical protein
MTEQEKLRVYFAQQGIDPNDAVADRITHAWMTRAQEPPPIAGDWKGTVQQILQRLDLGVPETPSQATTQIFSAMDTLRNAIEHANAAVQGLAMRDEIITNQGKVLDAFAMMLQLESGKQYMDMVPLMQAVIERAGTAPSQ